MNEYEISWMFGLTLINFAMWVIVGLMIAKMRRLQRGVGALLVCVEMIIDELNGKTGG